MNSYWITVLSIPSPEFPQHTIKKIIALKEDKRTMLLDVVGLVLLIPVFSVLPTLCSLFKLELKNSVGLTFLRYS